MQDHGSTISSGSGELKIIFEIKMQNFEKSVHFGTKSVILENFLFFSYCLWKHLSLVIIAIQPIHHVGDMMPILPEPGYGYTVNQ